MVAQRSLEPLVVVRIHVGQPSVSASGQVPRPRPTQYPVTFGADVFATWGGENDFHPAEAALPLRQFHEDAPERPGTIGQQEDRADHLWQPFYRFHEIPILRICFDPTGLLNAQTGSHGGRARVWVQSSENRYSRSSFDRLRAKPSSPRTSLMVCALRCCSSQIFSSTVPGAMSR